MTKLLITIVSILALASLGCGSQVLEGDVDHKTVSGTIDDTAWTILQNLPGADTDVENDRPSIRIDDEDYKGFFTSADEHAVITDEVERLLGQ